ncbi:guanosine monophosphate reductase [Spirochaetia bacterium]|nr:guanosine monophosphate reductase [Spirochaetia bacterium]GHU35400.1 guanosine monophosphate reductase [Spirochaetia bacterium]
MTISEAFSYDDVLLVPGYSEVLPRDCDTSTDLCAGIRLKIPVLSSAMDTVTEEALATQLALAGGAGVIHRNLSPEEQARQVSGVKNFRDPLQPRSAVDKDGRLVVGAAVSPQDYSVRMPLLMTAGVNFVVIDAAHGHTKNVCQAVSTIKQHFQIPVIGGNVVTREGTRQLIDSGSDAIKVGLGPGSICTTRIVSGVGVPQWTAVFECAEEAQSSGIPVIADGGIKYSGDISKAIGAGASVVMLGNLLAGVEEAPGGDLRIHGRLYKSYRGMGSIGALRAGAADRYQITKDEKPVPEGVEGLVPATGKLRDFIMDLVAGLQKGMGYCGCKNIAELQHYRRFVRITGAGLQESHVHDLIESDI